MEPVAGQHGGVGVVRGGASASRVEASRSLEATPWLTPGAQWACWIEAVLLGQCAGLELESDDTAEDGREEGEENRFVDHSTVLRVGK